MTLDLGEFTHLFSPRSSFTWRFRMKTGKNKSTNNFIIRVWSKYHYGETKDKYKMIYDGTVQNVRTGEDKHFHSVGEMLKILESEYKKEEKNKRSKK